MKPNWPTSQPSTPPSDFKRSLEMRVYCFCFRLFIFSLLLSGLSRLSCLFSSWNFHVPPPWRWGSDVPLGYIQKHLVTNCSALQIYQLLRFFLVIATVIVFFLILFNSLPKLKNSSPYRHSTKLMVYLYR